MNKKAEIKFRLTDVEKAHLVERAKAEGVTLSEYLRMRTGLVRKYRRIEKAPKLDNPKKYPDVFNDIVIEGKK